MTGRAITSANIENDARRRVGLPEEAQLVFYPNPKDADSKEEIISWDVIEECENYSVLQIETRSGTRRIVAGIIAFMQNPNFIELNRA